MKNVKYMVCVQLAANMMHRIWPVQHSPTDLVMLSIEFETRV